MKRQQYLVAAAIKRINKNLYGAVSAQLQAATTKSGTTREAANARLEVKLEAIQQDLAAIQTYADQLGGE